jgi:hypothetical protein
MDTLEEIPMRTGATPILLTKLAVPRSHDLGQRFVERDTLPGDHVDLSHNA